MLILDNASEPPRLFVFLPPHVTFAIQMWCISYSHAQAVLFEEHNQSNYLGKYQECDTYTEGNLEGRNNMETNQGSWKLFNFFARFWKKWFFSTHHEHIVFFYL